MLMFATPTFVSTLYTKGAERGKIFNVNDSNIVWMECLLAVGLRICIVLYYFLVVASIQYRNLMWVSRVDLQHLSLELMGISHIILFHASYYMVYFCPRLWISVLW